ncbi:uncharacterized protein LAJ45_04074 [Morchella importuna]|uniref:uncharacterized protein n=1 Tax=Morchella importuna TaxID=1174673 RepID=UPI001E8EA535|nr:uncharacterized protein LAJ45_04074 [Morchella importuna]KAH8152080.1 hypothetical protein LAJ45_04074 [Morchella importuna]
MKKRSKCDSSPYRGSRTRIATIGLKISFYGNIFKRKPNPAPRREKENAKRPKQWQKQINVDSCTLPPLEKCLTPQVFGPQHDPFAGEKTESREGKIVNF